MGFLTGIWVGVTYRSRNDSKRVDSLKSTPSWVTAHKAGNLEYIAYPAGNLLGWQVFFSVASVGWSLSQAAGFIFEARLSSLFTLLGKAPVNLGSFRDCLKLF